MSQIIQSTTWSPHQTIELDTASDFSFPRSTAKRSPPPISLDPPSPKRLHTCPASPKPEPYSVGDDLLDEQDAEGRVDHDEEDRDIDDDATDPDGSDMEENGLNGDKFTKSRAVGQSHRDNEKEHVVALLRDVSKLRTENILLFALFCDASYDARGLSISLRRIMQVATRDRPEDHLLTESEARARGMHRLAAPTVAILGMRYISTSLAVVLLEFLGVRRNLVSSAPDPGRRRRRRGSFRAPPTAAQANEICRYAVELFRDDAARFGVANRHEFVDAKLGALGIALQRWSEHEKRNNPAPFHADDDDELSDPPSSPTRPDAAEFGSPGRRRGEGAKKCSRCNRLKFTGSGHGRSKCADGYSISSLIPYPASPPEGEDGDASS